MKINLLPSSAVDRWGSHLLPSPIQDIRDLPAQCRGDATLEQLLFLGVVDSSNFDGDRFSSLSPHLTTRKDVTFWKVFSPDLLWPEFFSGDNKKHLFLAAEQVLSFVEFPHGVNFDVRQYGFIGSTSDAVQEWFADNNKENGYFYLPGRSPEINRALLDWCLFRSHTYKTKDEPSQMAKLFATEESLFHSASTATLKIEDEEFDELIFDDEKRRSFISNLF